MFFTYCLFGRYRRTVRRTKGSELLLNTVSLQRCACARCPPCGHDRMSSGNTRIRVRFWKSPDRKSPTAYEYLQVLDFAITCTFKVRYLTYPPSRFPGTHWSLLEATFCHASSCSMHHHASASCIVLYFARNNKVLKLLERSS